MPEENDSALPSLRPYKRCRTVSPPPPCATCSTQTITPTLDNLPIEIILRIVEEIGWSPVTIGFLLRTNHAISSAILTNETSLTVHFTKDIHLNGYNPFLLSSAPSRITYMEPFPIGSTLCRLVRKLSFTSGAVIPPFADFLNQFNRAMQLHHPAVARLPLDGLMRVQKVFLDATNALGWAYHHNTPQQHLPFEASPKIAEVVDRGRFDWVDEVHIREKIKEELPKSKLFDLKRMEIEAIFQSQPQLCHCCHGAAFQEHVSSGISLLYQMWDARIGTFGEGNGPQPHPSRCSKSVCSSPLECVSRDNVEEWIQLQGAETLAHLLEIIWIASQLYDFSGMKSKDFQGCEHSTDHIVNGHTVGHSNFTDPTRSLNERDQQWDRVEMECIFREMCLESGPAFLYACRPSQKGDTTRDTENHHWAIQLMQRGVHRLHAYEAGELVDEEQSPPTTPTPAGVDGVVGGQAGGHAEGSNNSITTTLPGITLLSTPFAQYVPRKTLQATLLQRFCHLQQCDLRMGWDEVFHVNAVAIDEIKTRMEEETAKAKREEEERFREAEKLRRVEISGLWFKGTEVEGTPLKEEGVSEGSVIVMDCAISSAEDRVGETLWMQKDMVMPGSFLADKEGKEERDDASTANGEQAGRGALTPSSSRDGANFAFKFPDSASASAASVAGASKRARTYSAICDGENHGEDGECVLDDLLWDVEDSEKWDKMEEFVGNNLDPPREDKGKGTAAG